MKIRSLIVAALVLAALAGTLYWSEHRKPAAETAQASADTPPAILKLDETAITRIEFRKKHAEPIVLAKNNSGWQITEPKPLRADQDAVSGVVSSLSSLNSERLLEEKASDVKAFGLDQPGLEIDVSEKDNKSQKLLLGADTPTGNAVYAMLAGDPRLFTIASYSKNSIDKGLDDLRDKRLLTMNADQISRMELATKSHTIEFARTSEGWQILKPEPLRADSVQVAELARTLTDARMDLSGSDNGLNKAASVFAHAAPVATVRVTDQSETQSLQVRKDKDTFYAKSSAADGIYKVDASLGHAFDRGLDDFRSKRLFDFGFNEPAKVEMHNGSRDYLLTKSGPDWMSNGRKMDAETVQSLLSQLRDLSANKFLETGFSDPVITLTVTSDDGKRVEKVAIAKSGDNYVARRGADSTLYQLDASAVDGIQKAADRVKPASLPGK